MSYFVLGCEAHPYNRILKFPKIRPNRWMGGRRLPENIPVPLEFGLDPDAPGVMREFYNYRIPLMRNDLVEAIEETGVDNLESYEAIVRDPTTDMEYKNYKAVNIVGAISCLDEGQSGSIPGMEAPMISKGIDSAVIDETRTAGALLFRLAENVGMILIHEKVKEHLQNRGFGNLLFTDPKNWSG